ncbi:MAG: LapA family protein [Phyllobacteriaceae bacterium]|nr:LapA family protein [Phyllobacteriaceae bacterium]
MLGRVATVLIVLPIAIVLVALAVANRGGADFTLDPFHPGNPALTLHWPLFVYLFIALGIGLVTGSAVTWMKQGRYRRQARDNATEIRRLATAPNASALPAAR